MASSPPLAAPLAAVAECQVLQRHATPPGPPQRGIGQGSTDQPQAPPTASIHPQRQVEAAKAAPHGAKPLGKLQVLHQGQWTQASAAPVAGTLDQQTLIPIGSLPELAQSDNTRLIDRAAIWYASL